MGERAVSRAAPTGSAPIGAVVGLPITAAARSDARYPSAGGMFWFIRKKLSGS
jgi:hypothetical protein